jgi:TRAP-type C4-dicarboxylate transport system permease small subunit
VVIWVVIVSLPFPYLFAENRLGMVSFLMLMLPRRLRRAGSTQERVVLLASSSLMMVLLSWLWFSMTLEYRPR